MFCIKEFSLFIRLDLYRVRRERAEQMRELGYWMVRGLKNFYFAT